MKLTIDDAIALVAAHNAGLVFRTTENSALFQRARETLTDRARLIIKLHTEKATKS